MNEQHTERTLELLQRKALSIGTLDDDYGSLLGLVGHARYVLIGESTHGTHEFYRERARITRLLIERHGFTAVAIEGDWPDALRVNRWVRGEGDDPEAEVALSGFQRFPTWMWRNTDVLEFLGWLRTWNEHGGPQVGFYGLDMYSLHTSIAAVLAYLEKTDLPAAARARERYACFDRFGGDPQRYGYLTQATDETCEPAVLAQLIELRKNAPLYRTRDGQAARDELFFAEQNARLVANAEAYYRAMFRGRDVSWNLRDRHMADTLDALAGHLSTATDHAKIVVWAHNSHVGDARATEATVRGEHTLGQLVRERHPDEARLVGLTTYQGTVTAASSWDGVAERKKVRPGLKGGWEALFHNVGLPRFALGLGDPAVFRALDVPRLARAIGVIYLPETERQSHYFHAILPRQFDAILHIDTTRAVAPIDRPRGWRDREEPPETYPSGL